MAPFERGAAARRRGCSREEEGDGGAEGGTNGGVVAYGGGHEAFERHCERSSLSPGTGGSEFSCIRLGVCFVVF